MGDAAEDDENVQTDWAKIYRAEDRVEEEVRSAPSNLGKRRKQMKNNKVSFLDNSDPSTQSQTQTVFVELNPAALLLEKKLESELTDIEGEEEGYEGEWQGKESCSQGDELSESEDFTVDNVKSKWSNL